MTNSYAYTSSCHNYYEKWFYKSIVLIKLRICFIMSSFIINVACLLNKIPQNSLLFMLHKLPTFYYM